MSVPATHPMDWASRRVRGFVLVAVAAGGLVFLACTLVAARGTGKGSTTGSVLAQLDLLRENNLATWWSSMVLLLIAILCAVAWRADPRPREDGGPVLPLAWLFLAGVFALLVARRGGLVARAALGRPRAGGRHPGRRLGRAAGPADRRRRAADVRLRDREPRAQPVAVRAADPLGLPVRHRAAAGEAGAVREGRGRGAPGGGGAARGGLGAAGGLGRGLRRRSSTWRGSPASPAGTSGGPL